MSDGETREKRGRDEERGRADATRASERKPRIARNLRLVYSTASRAKTADRAKPPSCLFHRLASLSSHVLVSRVPPRASGGARVGPPVDERRREDSSLAIFFAV